MGHSVILPGNSSREWVRSAIALLTLLLLSLGSFAQGTATDAASLEEEGLSRMEIISYIASGIGIIVIILTAWWLSTGKSRKKKESGLPADAPRGIRLSSGHLNDPYMRRKAARR